MHVPATLALGLAALAASPLVAQLPSSWVRSAPVAISPGALHHRGKVLWFRTGTEVHAFSAATRTWARQPISSSASVRGTNDWLVIEDPPAVTAFSSARGRFESIAVGSSAYVLNSSNGHNDGILLVLDGTTLSWFSGLRGFWRQRQVSPTASFAVQRNTALVTDGNDLLALSALHDEWLPLATGRPVTASGVGDTIAWATDGATAYGYSAIRNRWASVPVAGGIVTAPQLRHDVAVWSSPTTLLGFSGVRGRFEAVMTGEPTNVVASDHVGYASSADRRRHWLFSAIHATWTPLQTAEPATARVDAALVLLIEAGRAIGYSAPRASIATAPVAASAIGTSAAVAAALDTARNDLQLYSALTGSWHPAPPTARRALPALARNGALVDDGSSRAWAFSARSGRFVPRTSVGAPMHHVDPSSAIVAVEDDTALAVFEPRREVWIEAVVAPTDRPLQTALWRTTLVAVTATDAIGFGALHGTLERTPLGGSLVETRASSEVGAIVTDGDVIAFSPLSSARSDAQFPEFRRIAARGATVELRFTGAPGATAGGLLGLPSPVAFALPGLGVLALDPALLLPLAPRVLDADGAATIGIPVPDAPELSGFELALQALVLPIGGRPYLTRLASLRIS